MEDYLQKILRARVYDIAKETPLEKARNLSKKYSNNIWIKREDLQSVFSFKLRGAFNRMSQLSQKELSRGVVASSAGNHAQGVALSAAYLKCKAIIIMPITTPAVKVNAVKALNAEVMLYGDSYDESYKKALTISNDRGLTFIHPFDDPDVIAGQGTIAMEILRQIDKPPNTIYVAVGGGGLIGGVAAYVKSLWPEIEIVGVEPEDSSAMTQSLRAGEIVELNDLGLFADGVAVKKVGQNTFDLAKKYVDSMITVSTDEICAAIKDVFEDTRSILEPAGALAIAGLKSDIAKRNIYDRDLVAIACGANMNFERLRFVAERAVLGEEKEVMLAVEIPEKPGSLKELCILLGNKNLTEFSYRMSEGKSAYIFMGVEVQNSNDRNKLLEKINSQGFKCIDLSKDELSKVHLRHMVGGRLPNSARNLSNKRLKELLYRFEFPERPGALMRFVNTMKPEWTISIFHYRNHGADIGRIVIGVLVEEQDITNWNEFLSNLGYKCFEETNNPAYGLFLGAQN
tara:strand:+ start:525 stop:2066 length:1542 start_codon:yes stop_codon:yes gene_type:complete